MRELYWSVLALVAATAAGCSDAPASSKNDRRIEFNSSPRVVEEVPEDAPVARVTVALPKPPGTPATAPAPEGEPAPVPSLKEAASGVKAAAPTPVKNGVPASTLPADAEKLDVGFTGKGQYGDGQYLTEVVSTYFGAQERILMLQIQHNLDLYKAEHDNKPPKTQDEYMKAIIQDGGVSLPELPAGKRYVYDPKSGDLMVASEKKR